ncbi:MAG: DUF58 domain-containing protein [Roseibacillus sp.]|nr:DUF58 domain-containing protein [Roseibacillus sp.]
MLTPRGAILLGASLALIVLGFVRLDGVLITLGCSGYLLLAGCLVLSRFNLNRLAISLRSPTRLYANAPFDLRVIINDRRSFLDAFGIKINLSLADQVDIQTYAPWTVAHSASEVRLRGSIPGRSALAEHPYTLNSVTPLGLFHVKASGTVEHEILVFPRPLTPRELFTQGALHDASLLPGTTPGSAPGELRGIRPWQPGDPAKRIHWPASARSLSRRRGLRIRENDPPGFYPQHCTVLFHSYGMSGELIRADRFERALSLTCGTLRYLREHGIPTTFLADFNEWSPLTVSSRHTFGKLLISLTRAHRRNDTEAHDLDPVIERIPKEQSLIVLSDMPPNAWVDALPSRPAVVVDVRQHRYGTRKLQPEPATTNSDP